MVNMNKTLSLMVGFFLVVFLIGLASADMKFNPSTVNQNVNLINQNNTIVINFQLNNTAVTSYDNITWSGESSEGVWTLPTLSDSNAGVLDDVSATLTISSSFEGMINANITVADDDGTPSEVLPITINVTRTIVTPTTPTSDTDLGQFSCVEFGDLKIIDFSVSNLGTGDDDSWNPLDDIDIDFEVENNGDEDVEDVYFEFLILDGDKDVTRDFIDSSDDRKYDLGDIDYDDSESATISYKIYAKAYSDKNESICTMSLDGEAYYDFSVDKQWRRAILPYRGDINSGINVEAGDNVPVEFDVYNVGENKEKNVLIEIENTQLGIHEFYTLRNSKVGDKDHVSFNFDIPETASEGRYRLNVYTYFDYDDGDVLDWASYDKNSYDDMEEDYIINLDVVEMSAPEAPTIVATMSSGDARVGKDVTVSIDIVNPRDSTETYTVSVENYGGWADLENLGTTVFNLASGATATTSVTLAPTTAGENSFTIFLTDSEGNQYSKTAVLNVDESSIDPTELAWWIGGAILILIFLILVVAIVKAGGRSKTRESF
jgi:hypothetical protein